MDPLLTSYMADFGAEVIKLESNTRVDFGRRTEYYVGKADPNMNIYTDRCNQNKYGVLLNLRHPKAADLAKRLVKLADVVTENYTAGTMERLGLGYDELKKAKPDIIMVSCSFAGQYGPYRDFRGQGYIVSAFQGINDLTGWPDRTPDTPSSAFMDHYMPWMVVTTLLAALEHRDKTGRGQYLDFSDFEGCLDVLDTAILDYNINGRALSRQGNHHRAAAPHGAYRCQGDDRWCAIAVFNDEEWRSFCKVIGNPAWTRAERFNTLTGRLKNVDELDGLVEAWTQDQKAEDVMLKMQQSGVGAMVVKNAKDVYEDPQLAYRDHFWDPGDDSLKPFTFEAPSARLSKTPARLYRRFPFMGEHNDWVYEELLGLSSEEFGQLVEEGVIA
jgi:crotonobetainyl-CoA:carnitine CoA-transferase CaiB-like acyl-CoA transferase